MARQRHTIHTGHMTHAGHMMIHHMTHAGHMMIHHMTCFRMFANVFTPTVPIINKHGKICHSVVHSDSNDAAFSQGSRAEL